MKGPFVCTRRRRAEPLAGELRSAKSTGCGWRREEGANAGLWRIGPGESAEVPYDMTMNETIQILEGEVTIQIVDGPSHKLVPGSIASFAPGTRTRWRFTKTPFKELFVLS